MANLNPNPETRFKHGNAGGGRPKGMFTSAQLKALAASFFKMSVAELNAYTVDPSCKVLDAVIGKVLLKAIEFGDAHRMEFLLNRIIGRVKDVADDNDDDDTPIIRITRADGSVVEVTRPEFNSQEPDAG